MLVSMRKRCVFQRLAKSASRVHPVLDLGSCSPLAAKLIVRRASRCIAGQPGNISKVQDIVFWLGNLVSIWGPPSQEVMNPSLHCTGADLSPWQASPGSVLGRMCTEKGRRSPRPTCTWICGSTGAIAGSSPWMMNRVVRSSSHGIFLALASAKRRSCSGVPCPPGGKCSSNLFLRARLLFRKCSCALRRSPRKRRCKAIGSTKPTLS
eukprot:1479069-Amphidinium_carterae.1